MLYDRIKVNFIHKKEQHFTSCPQTIKSQLLAKLQEKEHSLCLKDAFFNPKVLIFFLFSHKNICCGYSLEAPQRGASNEYPQHMFLRRNKKNIYLTPSLI